MLSSIRAGKRAVAPCCARALSPSTSTFSTKQTPFEEQQTKQQHSTPTPSTSTPSSQKLSDEEQSFYKRLVSLAGSAPSLGSARGEKLRQKGWKEQPRRRQGVRGTDYSPNGSRCYSTAACAAPSLGVAGPSRAFSSSAAGAGPSKAKLKRTPRTKGARAEFERDVNPSLVDSLEQLLAEGTAPRASKSKRAQSPRAFAAPASHQPHSDLAHLSTPRPWHPFLDEYSRLTPGCYVDVRRAGTQLSGIYLGALNDGSPGAQARDHLILEANGAFNHVLPEDVMFILPFAERSLAERAAVEGLQSDAARSLWQLMRRFEFAAEALTRDLVERGAHELYDKLGEDKREITTTEAAKVLGLGGARGEVSLMAHLVLHRMMVDASEQFILDPVEHRSTGTFTVRPREELAELATVRDWVRQGTEEVDTFVREAVAAEAFGKQSRTKDGAQSDTVHAPFEWSPTSLRMIDFLKRAAGADRNIQPQPYLAITPSLLKAVDSAINPTKQLEQQETLTSTSIAGPEKVITTGVVQPFAENDMSREAILRFLVKVGVVAPWEDWVAHEGTTLANWEKEECTAEQVEASRPRVQGEVVVDALDGVRHDFGSLAVYTIDDPGALELDDGLSVEPINDGAGGYWIHAHIADPTTLIAPRSPMALLAQRRNQTEYFPEKTWAMLPHDFIEREKLSLGSQEGEEHKTLSISTRINERGDVQESVVRAGVVRNVKRLTYGAVDRALGEEEREAGKALVHPVPTIALNGLLASQVGRTRTTDDGTLLSDTVALSELGLLHRLASQLIQRRIDNDALFWSMPRASPSVTGHVTHHHLTPSAPTFYTSSPVVSLPLVGKDERAISPAQLLVSELMILANRSAARFAVERGISLPFVSQAEPSGASREAIERVLSTRDPKTGEASGADVLREQIQFTASEIGLDPRPHWPMGIRDDFGYTRVTSPLRRYGDLLGHWQLKGALIPGGGGAVFMRSQVGEAVALMREAHLRRGKADRHANAFWASYVLRAKTQLERGVDPLADEVLGNLSAIALRQPLHSVGDGRWLQQVLVREVGVMGQLWLEKESEGLKVGEEASVRLERVVVAHRSRLIVKRK